MSLEYLILILSKTTYYTSSNQRQIAIANNATSKTIVLINKNQTLILKPCCKYTFNKSFKNMHKKKNRYNQYVRFLKSHVFLLVYFWKQSHWRTDKAYWQKNNQCLDINVFIYAKHQSDKCHNHCNKSKY